MPHLAKVASSQQITSSLGVIEISIIRKCPINFSIIVCDIIVLEQVDSIGQICNHHMKQNIDILGTIRI